MGLPEEFNRKGTYSLGLLAFIAIISFSIGGTFTKVISSDTRFEEKIKDLREDMKKEDLLLREEDKRIEKKITRKIINHESIKHKEWKQ